MGRKPSLHLHAAFLTRKQFIPARGRKQLALVPVPLVTGRQFIPARGRKLPVLIGKGGVCRKQFIPARGRKRSGRRLLRSWPGNNSSPQGDGNIDFIFIRFAIARNNSSPQGDGNFFPPVLFVVARAETIHPRKGTETGAYIPGQNRFERNNSSPQGDGNHALTP